ncbi:MAG TPA: peptide MFS transporter [Bacteroidales bacterium]|nr:peptide MFS transporter [Bacteroidales bacterium]HPE86377.1 peptide MFS transporter [Bacteroidales bacterium]
MLKNHPKGLFVALFANMGERFGYYTMLAIFVLFLQAKYGFAYETAAQYFGIFLAFVYFMPLIGGVIADRVLGYGKTISLGLIVMFVGYLLIAIPSGWSLETPRSGLPLVIGGLAVISLGTGLFKGNLQALVGNLYDADKKYDKFRSLGFNIFYMGINVGAMFAPTAAEAVSNFMLKGSNLFYNGAIPKLAHTFLDGSIKPEDTQRLAQLAADQPAFAEMQGNLGEFSMFYINELAGAYHWAFGVACISLVASMLIFWGFRKYYKEADMTEKQKAASAEHKDKVIVLTRQETKSRMVALGLVMFVVIFFWMAFHQNGAAMTAFARDYTQDTVSRGTNIWFDLFGLLSIALSVLGLVLFFMKKNARALRIGGLVMFPAFAIIAYFRIAGYDAVTHFTPQMFQHFNPFFIVAITPIIVGVFSWMARKGIEPSDPKKIGIGMIITAIGFTVLVVGSLSLAGMAPGDIGETRVESGFAVSPYWLISTYFILTIAELFLSPIGLSFVSKVAPPKFKGLMQGAWLAATAIGNYGVALVGILWNKLQLWQFWGLLVVFCVLAAMFIFSILRRLENATNASAGR